MKVKHIKLNYSTYDKYYSCKRRFEYESVNNLLPVAGNKEDPSTKGYFKGSVIHNCIDTFNKGGDWRETFEELLAPKDYAIHQLRPDQSGSKEHLKRVIECYFMHYKNEKRKVIASELRLEMPLNDKVTLVGTIDEISEDASGISIWDHKTSVSLNRFMEPTLHVSDQFTQYIALARYNGYDTNKFVINGISTARSSLTKFEASDNKDLFWRYETYRSQSQIDEYLAMIAFEADRMIQDIENNTFTKTPKKGTCAELGSVCPYIEVCGALPESRGNMLKNNFKKTLSENPSFVIEYEV